MSSAEECDLTMLDEDEVKEDSSKEFIEDSDGALVMDEERTAMSSNKLDSPRIRVLCCSFPDCNFKSQSKYCMSLHMNSHVHEEFIINWDNTLRDELENNKFHLASHNKDLNHHNVKSNTLMKNLKKSNTSERNNENAREELDQDQLKEASDVNLVYLTTPEGVAGPCYECPKCELIMKRLSVYSLHVKTCRGNPYEAMDVSQVLDSSSCEDRLSEVSKSPDISEKSEETESLLRKVLEKTQPVRPTETAESVAQVSILLPSFKGNNGKREEAVGHPSEMASKPEENNVEVDKNPGSHSGENFRTTGNQKDLVKSVAKSACSYKADITAKEFNRCSKCPYSVSGKSGRLMGAHVRMHSHPKAIVCTIPGCFYRTDRMCNLKEHMRVHHSVKYSELDASANKSGEPKGQGEPDTSSSAESIPQRKRSRRDFAESQGVDGEMTSVPQIKNGGSDEGHVGKKSRKSSNDEAELVKAGVTTEEPAQSTSLASAQNPGKRGSRNYTNIRQCPYCPFQTGIHLAKHVALHSDPNACSCHVQGCYFKTKWPWYLKKHVDDKHSKSMEVPVIEKIRESEGAEMLGIANEDTGDQTGAFSAAKPRSLSPSMPKLRSISPIAATRGRTANRSGRGKSFSCSVSGCNFVTMYSGNVSAHVKQMHCKSSPDSSRFLCSEPTCTYVSTRPSDVKRHIRTMHKRNESVRKLICGLDGCAFRTNVQQVLDKHAERVHKKVLVQEATSSDIQHTSEIDQGEGFRRSKFQASSKFVCTAGSCEFNSRWPESLKLHIRSKHGKLPHIPQHACGFQGCDFKTNVKRLLAQHCQTIHEGKSKLGRTATNVTRGKENSITSRNCDQENEPSGIASKPENPASCTFCSYASKLSFFVRKHFQPCPKCKSPISAIGDERSKSTTTQKDNQPSPESSSTLNPKLACPMCKFVADSQVQAAVHSGVHKRPIVLVARFNVVR